MIDGIVMGIGFGLGLLILGAVLANLEAIGIALGVLVAGGAVAFYWGQAGLLIVFIGGLVLFMAKGPLEQEAERRNAANRAAFLAKQIREWQARVADVKARGEEKTAAYGLDIIRDYEKQLRDLNRAAA
jgi:hypothetical protein